MNARNNKRLITTPKQEPVYLLWERPNERMYADACVLNDHDGYRFLVEWQDGRCAMCGYDRRNLVLDHCHESGLARGFLCSPCNIAESKSYDSTKWDIYRAFNPCKMLKLNFYYNDFGSSPYPVENLLTKEQSEEGPKLWDDEFCYNLLKDYSSYRINLEWADCNMLREIVRKSFNHIAAVSGVLIHSERDKNDIQAAGAMRRYLEK